MIEISRSVSTKITRLLLKSIPIIPASDLFDIFEDLKKSKQDINEKIEKAYESLKETSTLVEDLQKDLTERSEKVSELRKQYEHYSKLADIEEEKIKPLLVELNKTVNKGKNFERIVSFVINIIAGIIIFAFGIWLGPKITNIFTSVNEKPVIETIK